VDRLVIDDKIRVRLGDSVETALALGRRRDVHAASTSGRVQSPKSKVQSEPSRSAKSKIGSRRLHSNKMCSPATGKSFDPPTPKHFSFNAPAGACPVCHGLGQKMVFDEALVVPDMDEPLESAIQPWRRAGKRMNIYYKAMLRSIAGHFNVRPADALQKFAGRFQKSFAERFRRGRRGFQILARRAKSAAFRVRSKACCRISNGSRRKAKANSSATGSSNT
jgi:excinuclease UvrABC ATPase subunit